MSSQELEDRTVAQLPSSIGLPTSLEQALVGRFLSVLNASSTAPRGSIAERHQAPFLTIVTRTQGLRPDTLRDVFLCLSGQSCIDFEHFLIGHKLTAEAEHDVRAIMDENPKWLRERCRLIAVDHGNRTAPLNVGFGAARGRYIAVLDDDDLVFGHWVSSFKVLAEKNSGSVLRCGTVYQRFDQVDTRFAKPSPRAEGELIHLYPSEFDFFAHLQENRTPLMALAFPRAAFSELGIVFDETLSTGEDWDYLMRVARLCGVASSPEITGIYRHWRRRSASRTDHAQQEWQENLDHVRAKQDQLDLLLPAGSAKRLRRLMDDRDVLARAVRLLDGDGRTGRHATEVCEAVDIARRVLGHGAPDELEALRAELSGLYGSVWWRIGAPVRWASAILGRRRFQQPEPKALTTAHLKMAINDVFNSTSWKLSAPLRLLHSRFAGGRQP